MSKIYSQEKLEELMQQLDFVLKCIGQLKQDMSYYVAHDGYDISARAMSDLINEKILLDVKISTLKSFLEE